jgi:hypothetical protein
MRTIATQRRQHRRRARAQRLRAEQQRAIRRLSGANVVMDVCGMARLSRLDLEPGGRRREHHGRQDKRARQYDPPLPSAIDTRTEPSASNECRSAAR